MDLTFREICFFEGVCPECGDSWVEGACRCDADADLLDEVDAHGEGCACCRTVADEVEAAPVVVTRPIRPVTFLTATTLRLGHGARWVDSDAISAGAF